jgi:2-oxoisovalerate dehydrogenase E1 component beta subunit
VARKGNAATVISWGTMVHVARAAIESFGIDAELIDVRTLIPLDLETICESVKKTGRCIVVHEAPRTSGYGAEIIASIQEQCFWNLESPILRVAGWDTPFPHAMEWEYMPSRERIAQALQQVMEN